MDEIIKLPLAVLIVIIAVLFFSVTLILGCFLYEKIKKYYKNKEYKKNRNFGKIIDEESSNFMMKLILEDGVVLLWL